MTPLALPVGALALAPVAEAGLDHWRIAGRVATGGTTLALHAALWILRGVADPAQRLPEPARLAAHRGSAQAAILALGATDETSGARYRQTHVTPRARAMTAALGLDLLARRAPRLPGIARHLERRHARLGDGLLSRAPTVLDALSPRLAETPFALSWGGLMLAHDPVRGVLHCTLPTGPGTALQAQVALPDGAAMTLEEAQLCAAVSPGLTLQSLPGLHLAGDVAQRPVQGALWIERGWGPLEAYAFAAGAEDTPGAQAPSPAAPAALMGTERFWLRLDPEVHLALTRYRARPGGAVLGSRAVLFEGARPMALPGGCEVEALHHWDSPASGTRHAIDWRIVVPDIGLEARFSPLDERSEHALPGGLTLWSGPGRLAGRIEGASFTGTGHGEVFGAGAMFTLRDRLRRRLLGGV